MRRLLSFSALCGAALVGLGSAASAASLQDAWKGCNARQMSAADRIAQCSTVVNSSNVNPESRAQALTARGFARLAQKDFARAIADFDAAISQNPNLAVAYYYRGALRAQTDPERAIADLDKAIAINPKDADYFRERSSIHIKQKNYERGIADLTTAIGLAKNPKTEYFLRGSAYRGPGRARQGDCRFPGSRFCWTRTMTCSAGISSASAAKSPPRSSCRPASAARTTLPTRRGSRAARLSSSRACSPAGRCRLPTVTAATRSPNSANTIASLPNSNELIGIRPQAGCAYLNRGRAWYYKHDLDRAIADYTQAAGYDRHLHEAYASRGTAYFDRREFARAIADYDAAISIDPYVPMYFSDRGNTRYQMGDMDRAIADYGRAIEIDPDYAPAYARRGWAFLKTDDLARAETDFDKALELKPGDAYAASGRAQVYQRQNKPVPESLAAGLSFEKFRSMVQQPGAEAPAQEKRP